jgi:hypothetical protein
VIFLPFAKVGKAISEFKKCVCGTSFQLVFDVDPATHLSVCKKKLHCLDLHVEIITTKLGNAQKIYSKCFQP